MACANVITTEFDQTTLETLENCITKISDHLRKKFNPDEAESKSLFRLFCSSINTRSRIMNKILNSIEKTNESMKKNENAINTTKSKQSIVENIPSNNQNSSYLTEKKKKRGIVGRFWRNKKLA
jgi:hypothetical protein